MTDRGAERYGDAAIYCQLCPLGNSRSVSLEDVVFASRKLKIAEGRPHAVVVMKKRNRRPGQFLYFPVKKFILFLDMEQFSGDVNLLYFDHFRF